MKKIFSIMLAAVLAMAVTSCVKDEIYPGATIKNMKSTVAYSEADAVTVSMSATALVDIVGAQLYYSVAGGAYQMVEMTGSNGSFSGVIPAGVAKDEQEVKYYVKVLTAGGSTDSAVGSYVVGQVPVDYKGLVLNELNGNDKFIELYNGGDHDIFLGGITMTKDGKPDVIWTGPKVNIKKGEYLVLWTTGTADIDEAYIFNAGLSAKKPVQITISKPSGEVIDDFNTSNSSEYLGSFGRNADTRWHYQPEKTPGAKNIDGVDPLPLK